MLRNGVAALLAFVIACGSSLALASCELECRHELNAAEDQEIEAPLLETETVAPHSCHEQEPADTSGTFIRGSQTCTHSAADSQPASINRDTCCPAWTALVFSAGAVPADPIPPLPHDCPCDLRDAGRGPSVQLSLRI